MLTLATEVLVRVILLLAHVRHLLWHELVGHLHLGVHHVAHLVHLLLVRRRTLEHEMVLGRLGHIHLLLSELLVVGKVLLLLLLLHEMLLVLLHLGRLGDLGQLWRRRRSHHPELIRGGAELGLLRLLRLGRRLRRRLLSLHGLDPLALQARRHLLLLRRLHRHPVRAELNRLRLGMLLAHGRCGFGLDRWLVYR